MTILVPLQYGDIIKLNRIRTYDDYTMFYEYFKIQYNLKKSGKKTYGWQIAKGGAQMGDRVNNHNIGIIS